MNIAMVGTGFIGRAHANAFHQVGHFFDVPARLRTKVVCGRDATRLAAFAQQWEWEETATDWRAVVERPDVDVVDIAAPNALHGPIALAAARAGKIVWCEKPLAVSVAEAEEMAEAVRGRPNLVWFNYRRVPAIALAKRLIEEGRLGEIFHYRAYYFNQSGVDASKAQSWRYKRAEAGSGAIGDLLSHLIDTSRFLNGEISELAASKKTFFPKREVDDAVQVMARFANGSLGSFEASRFGVGRRNGNGFEIYGSRGNLAFDLEDMNRLRFFDATEAAETQGEKNILVTGAEHPYGSVFWKPGHIIGYEHTFIATLGDFLMAGVGEFHADFEDGLAVQKVMGKVDEAAGSGEWVRV